MHDWGGGGGGECNGRGLEGKGEERYNIVTVVN